MTEIKPNPDDPRSVDMDAFHRMLEPAFRKASERGFGPQVCGPVLLRGAAVCAAALGVTIEEWLRTALAFYCLEHAEAGADSIDVGLSDELSAALKLADDPRFHLLRKGEAKGAH